MGTCFCVCSTKYLWLSLRVSCIYIDAGGGLYVNLVVRWQFSWQFQQIKRFVKFIFECCCLMPGHVRGCWCCSRICLIFVGHTGGRNVAILSSTIPRHTGHGAVAHSSDITARHHDPLSFILSGYWRNLPKFLQKVWLTSVWCTKVPWNWMKTNYMLFWNTNRTLYFASLLKWLNY